MGRSLCSCDNCYNIPNFRATGYVCKTNLPSNTAFRGFGAPQALMAVENVINDVATFLQINPHKVFVTDEISGGSRGVNPAMPPQSGHGLPIQSDSL